MRSRTDDLACNLSCDFSGREDVTFNYYGDKALFFSSQTNQANREKS